MFKLSIFFLSTLVTAFSFLSFKHPVSDDDTFLTYTVDTKKQDLRLYWKDEKGQPLKSIANLKAFVEQEHKQLLFAMNAGMYKTDNSPLGLFIDNGKKITALNTRNASGNFYMKPNGVFYLDKSNNAGICKTEDFRNAGNIKYATQSGPMLVIDGKIHPGFTKGSVNVNIRNGVGILPDKSVVFVISKKEVNLYDFADYFKKLGCSNALFLDGFVCRTYLPEKNWLQTDGNFGVMIAVVK